MEVLNSIALPQSTEHFHLLLFIYNIVMAVAMPYVALLTGALVLAVWVDRRRVRDVDMYGRRLSREMVNAVLPTKTVFTFLGVLPSLSTVFVYAQIFQGTPALASGFAALGVLLLVAAGIAGFFYQYTFRVEDALLQVRSKAALPEAVAELEAGARGTHRRSGTIAVWTILGAMFCFSAAHAVGANPAHWHDIDSLFAAFLSLDVWLSVLLFLTVAAAMTGIGILYFHHRSAAAANAEAGYTAHMQQTGIRLSTAALLSAPVALVLTMLTFPDSALSGWVYVLAALAVLAFFGALHALYAYVRLGRAGASAYALGALILATTALVTKDQVALHNATRDQAVILAHVYDQSEEALKSALGVAAKQLSGEDIFNAKCSACHLFDQKKVGPPYASVLPKYKGKKPELVSFILNPSKVDPAFPPMPSQGLKPAEADSIATYLLGKVKG